MQAIGPADTTSDELLFESQTFESNSVFMADFKSCLVDQMQLSDRLGLSVTGWVSKENMSDPGCGTILLEVGHATMTSCFGEALRGRMRLRNVMN